MRRVSIKDVAREAGVSTTTVSYVLNEITTQTISSETSRRVREVAKRMGYVPNLNARSLTSRKTNLIGIVIPQTEPGREFMFDNPFYGALLSSLEFNARRNGYHLLLTGPASGQSYIGVARNRGVDGIVIVGSYPSSSLDELHQLSIPVVLIDTYVTDESFHTIGINDRQGGRMATEYLLSRGHRGIAFVSGGISEHGVMRQRFLGYQEALEAAGLQVREERLGEDARVTILGHVQRGGSPSAYDRNLSSLLGQRAAREALREHIDTSILVGMQGNRPTTIPLMEAVELTRQAQASCTDDTELKGFTLRGPSLVEAYHLFHVVNGSPPATSADKPRRIALVHSGSPAPGMNMAVRTATRWALAHGHEVLGIRGGFTGLARGDVEELDWMGVSGWAGLGGAELGTSHGVLSGPELYSAARVLEDRGVEALLMIGGWSGYEGVHRLYRERTDYPAFRIPMLCLPASIDNNLPGSEFSVGADTALNSIVEAADRIKRSAVANRRCFLVEVMGDMCGYLAYMSGLATGAEKVYLHEAPLTAARLLEDLQELKGSFERGRTVALVMVNEKAHPLYTTGVLRALFEEEGRVQFDVRQAILGHLQQGGDPTPFDRTMASRLARAAIEHLQESLEQGSDLCGFLGTQPQGIKVWDFHDYPRMIDENHRRPRNQWWLDLNVVVGDMATT